MRNACLECAASRAAWRAECRAGFSTRCFFACMPLPGAAACTPSRLRLTPLPGLRLGARPATHTPLLDMSSQPLPLSGAFLTKAKHEVGLSRAVPRLSLSCTVLIGQVVRYMHARIQCTVSQLMLLLDRIGRGLEEEMYGGDSPAAPFVGYAQQQRTRTIP